jgi:hypothetical protein
MGELKERRKLHRARTLKGGRIVFNRGFGAAECTVRNLTDLGALLEIGEVVGIPSEFELQINSEIRRNSCRVIWRDGRRLGVIFVDPAPDTASPQRPDPPADPRPGSQ